MPNCTLQKIVFQVINWQIETILLFFFLAFALNGSGSGVPSVSVLSPLFGPLDLVFVLSVVTTRVFGVGFDVVVGRASTAGTESLDWGAFTTIKQVTDLFKLLPTSIICLFTRLSDLFPISGTYRCLTKVTYLQRAWYNGKAIPITFLIFSSSPTNYRW